MKKLETFKLTIFSFRNMKYNLKYKLYHWNGWEKGLFCKYNGYTLFEGPVLTINWLSPQ